MAIPVRIRRFPTYIGLRVWPKTPSVTRSSAYTRRLRPPRMMYLRPMVHARIACPSAATQNPAATARIGASKSVGPGASASAIATGNRKLRVRNSQLPAATRFISPRRCRRSCTT